MLIVCRLPSLLEPILAPDLSKNLLLRLLFGLVKLEAEIGGLVEDFGELSKGFF